MTVTVIHGDSREKLRDLADASVDAVVTDPPYALVSITKRWSGDGPPPREGVYRRSTAGFMGKQWDTGETAFDPAFWSEVLRVLKPGGHLIAFGGTRTYHRLVCAIEDGGFEIRDQLAWLFGSGFPKSHDVAKGIDKAAGAEGERIITGEAVKRMIPGADQNKAGWEKNNGREYTPHTYAPGSPDAQKWQGWGTALKPAQEPICLARKPLIGTVAANVLEHGTGALNIDASRIPSGADHAEKCASVVGLKSNRTGVVYGEWAGERTDSHSDKGRWPANVIHDGSPEVLAGFPDTGNSPPVGSMGGGSSKHAIFGAYAGKPHENGFGDSGSAARFFYTAKADKQDRLQSKHPTVKPVDLMAYLIKLVTPPGGLVLDPFAGSGTTGMAAMREGFDCVLIEREAEYVADIKRRLDHVHGADTPLFSEIAS